MAGRDWLALAWLTALGIAPCLLLWRVWRTTRYSAFQFSLWCLTYGLVRLQWRAQLPARPPYPAGQGAVLIANHRSSIDPFFVQMTMLEPSHWMVAKEYCQSRAFGWFLRQCEVIPTSRGGVDTASTKTAIRFAKEGGLVGLFPEGRINQSDSLLLPMRPGAILVALKARVPVVPCYIAGSPFGGAVWSPFLRTARVKVVYGEPIDLSEFYDREHEDGLFGELMVRCAKRIAELAGEPDFEPQLAGRRWLTASRSDARDQG